MSPLTQSKAEQVAAIRLQIKHLQTQLQANPNTNDRTAIEEDLEDLRQDLIELLHY